ncbi:MAG: type II toxin-antitoxin system PemK/MazF family toxin [Atopobiaceae bacterium]|nr:type II toxin-antitoxin system PemK/MazF family toxin [Atopobiaceae bacterium]
MRFEGTTCLVIQSDELDSFDSVILCLFTTIDSSTVDTRVFIPAAETNGLHKDSYIMTEKIITVNKDMLGNCIGVLSDEEMNAISNQLRKILNL